MIRYLKVKTQLSKRHLFHIGATMNRYQRSRLEYTCTLKTITFKTNNDLNGPMSILANTGTLFINLGQEEINQDKIYEKRFVCVF